ncbi:MAG TPA: type II toxin-antitoxin system VapC family toxin [Acidimicrobiales bacterium]|nr:type II toxin-antitoxin system VapC family toxin [Acidimicrobiales bacterium]
MADLLVDTDVCIDHLEGVTRLPGRRTRLAYSVVTRAELLAGPAEQQAQVRRLLAPLQEIVVDRRIAERAGDLRRAAGLRMPDALVAATALVHDLTLHTRNHRDFRTVDGLRLRPRRPG